MNDKKLKILAFKWLLPIEKSRELLNTKFATFELSKDPIKKGRNELLDSIRPLLRGAWYDLGTWLVNNRYTDIIALDK